MMMMMIKTWTMNFLLTYAICFTDLRTAHLWLVPNIS